MWAKIVEFFKSLAGKEMVKKYLTPVILKAIGLSGGVWTWIVTFIAMRIIDPLFRLLGKEARLKDQEIIDEKNIEEYKADKAAGAPVEKLIEDETRLLNGDKRR